MSIPGGMWSIIMANNGFAGINLSPKPRPNANGSYNIKLSAAEWAIFQQNQQKGGGAAQSGGGGGGEVMSSDGVDITRDASTCPSPFSSPQIYTAF